ncbi:MAG: CHAT domain-containing protein [Crocinitomicaceae bacterium]|nr:CHAT domain-containing protein [Crocinitomicaceae bacterium]
MSKHFIFFIYLLFLNSSFGQLTHQDTLKIDSLQLVIKNAQHDSTIIKAWRTWDSMIDRYDQELDIQLISKMDSLTDLNLSKDLNKSEKLFFQTTKGNLNYDFGVMYNKQRNMDSALFYFNSALALLEFTENYKKQSDALEYIADIYDYLGKYDTAIVIYNRSLDINKSINDSSGIAYDLVGIGLLYQRFSDYDRAMQYYQEGLKIRLALGDPSWIAGAYNNIGVLYYYLGEYGKSADYFIQALEIRIKKGDDPRGLSNVYGNIGAVLLQQGDNENAIIYMTKSLEIEKERDDKRGLAYIYSSLGMAKFQMNEYETSEKFLQRSIELYTEIEDIKGLKDVYNNLATYYRRTKLYDKASESVSKALKLSEEIGSKSGAINARRTIGLMEMDKNNFTKAVEEFNIALQQSRSINFASAITSILSHLSICMLATDSTDQARKYALELIELRNKDIATNFPVLSEFQKEKYFNTLRSDYDLFYDYALIQGNNDPILYDIAYNNTLMLKGLLLKSSTAMKRSILNSNNKELIDQYYDWISLKRRIAKAYSTGKDVSEMEKEAEELEKNLVKGSNAFSDIKAVQNLSWKDVQANLKKGEAAIEFVKFSHIMNYKKQDEKSNVYAALIIDKECEHPTMLKLFEEQELEEIIGTFPGNNYSYINGIYGSKKQNRIKLYELIWKPMEHRLKDITNVYISADGLLHKIAFAALAKEQDVYLCDLYNIETKSSTGKLASISNNEASASITNVSLFGGINYNTDSSQTRIWSYLEGSLNETEKIEKILKKNRSTYNYYTSSEATEDQFKRIAPESNILHIATHGYFYADPDEIEKELTVEEETEEELVFRGNTKSLGVSAFVNSKNPLMRSGLAFANANDVWNKTNFDGEDGVLTAAEVSTLDLRGTELVVLSACETGLGDIKGSEGVYGLQRSFKMAGVNYIIMSLWQVPDKETAEFMSEFYTNLTKLKDVSKAFITTQKKMRTKYDPYFWAAFILIQ